MNHAIAGTASASDFAETIPTPIVIPAQQAAVAITITPVDDPTPENNETVEITLLPDAAYDLGSSSVATIGPKFVASIL